VQKHVDWQFVGRISLEILLLVYTLVLLILGDSYLKWFLWGFLGLVWLVVGLTGMLKKRSRASVADERLSGQLPAVSSLYLFFTLWLMWSGVSLWWSQYVPLGLGRLTQIMTGMIGLEIGRWLVRGYGQQSSHGETDVFKRFALGMTLLGWVLALGAVFFMVFPIWAQLLPGFNILVATYGHNHVAAFFILALPVQMWLTVVSLEEITKKLSGQKKIDWKEKWQARLEMGGLFLIMAIPVLIMATSFGRVAMLVGLGQLLGWLVVVEWLQKKKVLVISLLVSKLMRLLLAGLAIVLASVLIAMLVTSAFPQLLPDDFCATSPYKIQLCKSFKEEGRLAYWHQGWESFRQWPWTGYGLGTFALVSIRFRLAVWQATSYTHNEYWSQFVETGVLGGVLFLGLMVSAVWVVVVAIRRLMAAQVTTARLSSSGLTTQMVLLFVVSLSLSWLGMMVNVFFDFDWSFSGLWLLSWMMMGMMAEVSGGSGKKAVPRLRKWVLVFIAGWLVTLMSAYGLVEFALWKGWHGWVARHASIFVEHTVLLATSDKLSEEEKLMVFEKHKMYPKVVEVALKEKIGVIDDLTVINNSINSNKKSWLLQLIYVDPWSAIALADNTDSFVLLLSRDELEPGVQVLTELLEKQVATIGENRVSYSTKQAVLRYKKRLIDLLLDEVQSDSQISQTEKELLLEKAAKQIIDAQHIDTWAVANWSGLGFKLEDREFVTLLDLLTNESLNNSGLTGDLWVTRLMTMIEYEFAQFKPEKSPQKITKMVKLAVAIQPWKNFDTWKMVSKNYLDFYVSQGLAVALKHEYQSKWQILEKQWIQLVKTNPIGAKQILSGWEDAFREITSQSQQNETDFVAVDEATMQIGYLLMAHENAMVKTYGVIDFSQYELAWQRNPHELRSNKIFWWIYSLRDKELQQLPSNEVLNYLNLIGLQTDPSSYAGLVKEHQVLINSLIAQTIMHGEYDQIGVIEKYYEKLPYLDKDEVTSWQARLNELWESIPLVDKVKLLPQLQSLKWTSTRIEWEAGDTYQKQLVDVVKDLALQKDFHLLQIGLDALSQTFTELGDVEKNVSYQSRVALTKELQLLALNAVRQPDREKYWPLVQQATNLMQQTLPGDYYVLVQMGNMYVAWAQDKANGEHIVIMNNDHDRLLQQAEEAYKACLRRFSEQNGKEERHNDCFWSLQDVYVDPPYQQYEAVAKIIIEYTLD
jgi:O-antigen ligase